MSLTLSEARAVVRSTQDTAHSITEFIELFATGIKLSELYDGGSLRPINATRVFGGYLSGALKIDSKKWEDLTQAFYKKPAETARILATGGDNVLVALNNLKAEVDEAADEALAKRRATGKAHASAVDGITKAREKFVQAGAIPSAENIDLLKAEVNALSALLKEIESNTASKVKASA